MTTKLEQELVHLGLLDEMDLSRDRAQRLIDEKTEAQMASQHEEMWLEIRVLAEGSDWKRDAEPGEELVDWAAKRIKAYPKLVKVLKDLTLRCDGEEGVRADGSNIPTIAAHAILRQLGEEV